jgi:hypothetical protein
MKQYILGLISMVFINIVGVTSLMLIFPSKPTSGLSEIIGILWISAFACLGAVVLQYIIDRDLK